MKALRDGLFTAVPWERDTERKKAKVASCKHTQPSPMTPEVTPRLYSALLAHLESLYSIISRQNRAY